MKAVGWIVVLSVAAAVVYGSHHKTATVATVGGDAQNSTAATSVEFSVTGYSNHAVDVTYGNDSSNYKGENPPFSTSLPIRADALYYDITAQLQGSGIITCRVTIGGVTRVGHARGGYNICSAQLNQGYDGTWD